MTHDPEPSSSLRPTLLAVVGLNLAYFAVEIGAGLSAGSVSLFADSIDFLEDASLSLLVLVGLALAPQTRARLGMALAGILVAPGIAALWMAWQRLASHTAPDASTLGVVGAGALFVNTMCALLLARHRAHGGSLVKAAFLSARNDVLANIAIIAAGFLTAATRSAWPDLAVGIGIALVNAGAAWEVWETACGEARDAEPPSI